MKKTLLTILFLGATLFASAQKTSISYDASGANDQIFTAGKQTEDNLDVSIVTSFSEGGKTVENNNFIGIAPLSAADDSVTGVMTFTLTTDSATAIDANLKLEMAKRAKGSVTGTVSVSGYPDQAFSAVKSSEVDGGSAETINFEYGTQVELSSGTPLTITITLSSMLHEGNTTTGIFRLAEVNVNKAIPLSNDVVNQIEVGVSPNPVTGNFTVVANDVIKSVKLYSITGGLVKTFGAQASYSIADVAAGVYFANVETATGSKTIKIIKK